MDLLNQQDESARRHFTGSPHSHAGDGALPLPYRAYKLYNDFKRPQFGYGDVKESYAGPEGGYRDERYQNHEETYRGGEEDYESHTVGYQSQDDGYSGQEESFRGAKEGYQDKEDEYDDDDEDFSRPGPPYSYPTPRPEEVEEYQKASVDEYIGDSGKEFEVTTKTKTWFSRN